jgi:heme A synthase
LSSLVVALHLTLARALLLFALLLGVWGGYQFLRHRALSGGFRSSYLLMLGLTAVQGLFGAVAFFVGGHPKELLHIVYGIFAVLFLPGVYVWASSRAKDTEAAILAASCWIVLIAYARGFMTGA